MNQSTMTRAVAIRFIVCLGIVSLFADMTYEGAYSIIGPFFKELGMSAALVGVISGAGEMIAASLRYFSGRFADRTRAYWPIVFIGYGLNVLVIPALAFAASWPAAAVLVAAERTGKALRGPARDVLLSDATKEVGHGFGFGVHAAMDQTGAVLGPLIMAWMVLRLHRFGPAFLPLAIPALLALTALIVAKHYHPAVVTPPKAPPNPQELPRLFRMYVIASGLLACGFVDFPLLAYHFQRTGVVKPEVIPLLYAFAMGITGAAALVMGKLFDRHGIVILVLGTIVSMATLPLGFLGGFPGAVASAACWGIGLGAQDATLRAGIAQVVSMNKRGSAFGSFNAVYGVMWFAGSAIMGLLYDREPGWLVAFGVAFQVAAAVMFLALRAPLRAEVARVNAAGGH